MGYYTEGMGRSGMCGIAGVLQLDGAGADAEMLSRMAATLHHRGPDAREVLVAGPMGFAHTRLSIIDLAGGRQPMTSADGRYTITFNGEIFNYLELREELRARGCRFRTESDTEVLLQAFSQFGDDCVGRLNGQWAFAIWDRRRQRMFFSRDRSGVRPLYYSHHPGRELVFASEIKALLEHPSVSREMDPCALDEIFTFWSPTAPRTVLKDVRELPAGHNMSVDKGGIRSWTYWEPDFRESPALRETAPEALADELLELLIDATRIRLRADVPVAAYLSGGLDSSLTTALIRRFTDAPLRTFSVAFDDAEFDESGFQQQVSQHLQTEHCSVRCTHEDIGRVFPEVIRHTERPILRTAPAPLFLLSQLVREAGYKVVVTGEGADEFLGGYDIFKETAVRRFWARVPESRIRPELLRRLYPYLPNLQSQPPAYLRAFFHVRPETVDDPLLSHRPRWEMTSRLKQFFSAETRRNLQDADAVAEFEDALPAWFRQCGALGRAQYLEATHLLPGYILSSQGDRMAMAHSVEGRFPFLDHRVTEFASRLPRRMKMHGLREKHLLKRVAREFLPESIVDRPKQPYRAPDAVSFFDPATGQPRFDYVGELLCERAVRRAGLFDPAAVARLVAKVAAGKASGTRDNMALVGILSTQLLCEQMREGVSAADIRVRTECDETVPATV